MYACCNKMLQQPVVAQWKVTAALRPVLVLPKYIKRPNIKTGGVHSENMLMMRNNSFWLLNPFCSLCSPRPKKCLIQLLQLTWSDQRKKHEETTDS